MKYTTTIFLLGAALCACNTQQQSQTQRQVTDAYLVTAVSATLATIDADAMSAVHVSASHGVVTLRGESRSLKESAQYLAGAKSIGGVKSVVDDLRVNPHLRGVGQSAGDAALTVEVSAAIAAQAGINVFHVSPSVKDGVVTLTGTVPNRLIEQTVGKTVASVSGVKRVVNRLRLSS